MRRTLILIALVALGLGAGGYAVAQDQGTPPAGSAATPDAALCATPLAETDGTPAAVVAAPTTAATPGTPVGLFPCATPIDATPISATQGATPNGDTAAAVTVAFVDLAFEPAELTIPADTDVPFRVVNQGAIPHNFAIDDPAVFSGDLQPGASSDLVVNLPSGTYEFICTIPGHAAAGMVGTLIVQ